MKESKLSVVNGARLAMVVLALLVALAAGQAFCAKSAEAGPVLPGQGGDGGTFFSGSTSVPPDNDNFVSGRSFSYYPLFNNATYSISGNTTLATLEAGEPKPYSATKDCGIYGIDKSVWFKITPSNNSQIKVSTAGSSFDTVLGLYKGSSLTSLQQLNCSNDNSSPNWTDNMTGVVTAGQTYYLQLSGTGGLRSGAYKVSVTLSN
jgi:hypothetical protein